MNKTGVLTVIDARSTTFFRLFCGGRFEVPWHQRRYDWTTDHVDELLHDIDDALKADSHCYFLGTVILVKSAPNAWLINDGQQRMVTLSLVCACLRDQFATQSDSQRMHMANRVLFNVDESAIISMDDLDHQPPRLTPPRDDKICYNLMVRGRKIGANGKLTLAWRKIEKFVVAMSTVDAKRFFDFLIQRLEFACLDIPESVDANSVYETINCRGKQLDDLDLIRNHLYSYFNSEDDITRRDSVHENLENIRAQLRDDSKFSDYARCYFQSRYGFLHSKNFYREARRKIQKNAGEKSINGIVSSPSNYVYDLVDDFARREKVELFRAIAAPSLGDPFIGEFVQLSGHADSTRNLSMFLRELNTYKVTQPLLFALLFHYVKEADRPRRRSLAKWIHSRVKHVTSFVMRTAFVSAKFEPSRFANEFSALAVRVMTAVNPSDVPVDDCLKECDSAYGVIDDVKFTARMCEIEMKDSKKIRRFLLGINYDLQSDSEMISETGCTVEHIFPRGQQHWHGWSHFEDTNPREWVHRVGNLTLLSRQDNKPGAADNRNFATKKQTCSRSVLRISQDIAKSDIWSPKEIVARQKRLVRRAAKKVWSFEPSMTR